MLLTMYTGNSKQPSWSPRRAGSSEPCRQLPESTRATTKCAPWNPFPGFLRIPADAAYAADATTDVPDATTDATTDVPDAADASNAGSAANAAYAADVSNVSGAATDAATDVPDSTPDATIDVPGAADSGGLHARLRAQSFSIRSLWLPACYNR